MFFNTLKTAVRNLRKHKGTFFISLAGQSIGTAFCILMLIYVAHEKSYDRHFPSVESLYRISIEGRIQGQAYRDAMIPALPALETEFPDVEASCRLFSYSWREKALFAKDDIHLYEDRFFLAEPSFIGLFGLHMSEGDPHTALDEKTSIILSRRAARRFFPEENPMGKRLTVKNLGQAEYFVTGIFEDFPANSHFHPELVASLSSGNNLFWEGFEKRNSGYTYLKLAKGASSSDLEKKLPAFFQKHMGEITFSPFLQPLTDIHLHSHFRGEIETNGNIRFVSIFAALALIILFVACFNSVSMGSARMTDRAVEAGLRKVVGARRGDLLRQFIGESLFLSLLTLPPTLLLIFGLLPSFNALVQRDITFTSLGILSLSAGCLLLTLIVGLLSGGYPAALLSACNPLTSLKGFFSNPSGHTRLRNTLVVVQYSVSVGLIIGTLAVTGQLRYIQKKDLGYQKENIIIIPLKDLETTQNYDLIKDSFLQNPSILSVSGSLSLPSNSRTRHPVWYEGLESETEEDLAWNAVDYDFIRTYGMELIFGRDLSKDLTMDDKNSYLINETAARILGWEEPVGKSLQLSNKNLKNKVFGRGRVIGVIRDFHYRSLHEGIEPLVLNVYKEMFRFMAVRIMSGSLRETLSDIKTKWKNINPERPLEYTFFDDQLDTLYQEDRRTGKILAYSTVLSLVIACLGFIGLAAYSGEKRKKEIGIRKVLGASVQSILSLLTRDMFRLVLLSNLVAWPLAYLAVHNWMLEFAYRIPLDIWLFLTGALASLLIALLTIGYQSLKTALADPARVIRYE